MFSKLFVIFAVIFTATANLQHMTLYEDAGQAGTFIKIQEQIPNLDLSLYRDFLKNASSYCSVGWWVGYTNPYFNVEGGVAVMLDQNDGNPRCSNRVFTNFKSLRYLGNQNTEIPSLSLYSKLNYHGYEALVDPDGNGSGYEQLPFGPVSYVSTGFSNWTFYGGQNFSGFSICVQSNTNVQAVSEINSDWPVIQSVSPGCN